MQQTDAQNGFSLIELIVAMALVSILAATVMISVSVKGTRAVITQAEQFRRDLSHIQMLAMSWGLPLRLTVASTGYTVTCQVPIYVPTADTPCDPTKTTNNVPIDPATGKAFTAVLTDGVTLTAVSKSGTATIVDFDTVGRPNYSTSLISDNPARTFTLSGNGRKVDVSLRPITGFAEVSY